MQINLWATPQAHRAESSVAKGVALEVVDPSKSADQSADEHQAQRAEPPKAKGAALDAMDPEHRGLKGCDSIQASNGPTLQSELPA